MTGEIQQTADNLAVPPPEAQPLAESGPSAFRKKFNRAVSFIKKDVPEFFHEDTGYTAKDFFKQDKGFQPALIITGILMGTTALVTPALMPMIGTGIAVGAGVYLLNKVRKMEGHGRNALLTKGGLAALGLAGLATPFVGGAMATAAAMGGGLYLLAKTADMLVDNSSALGKKAGISSMALGVGLGVLTSLPELVVSLTAMAAGNPGIAIGNITGSNTANLLLILGATAMIRKIQTTGMSWKFNTVAMLGATAALGAQLAMGVLNPVASGLMLGALGLYMWKAMKVAQKDQENAKNAPAPTTPEGIKAAAEKAKRDAEQDAEDRKKPESKVPKRFNVGWGLAGLAGLVGAATFTVPAAVAFGTAAGVSAAVVGALAVAVGTSLPELMVNVKSALKGDTDMAVGNILGSNVFNVLGIMGLVGLTGMTVPSEFDPKASALGILNVAGFGLSAAFAAATLAKTKGELNKKHGAIWVGLYAAFAAANFFLGSAPVPGAEAAAAPIPAAPPPPVPKPF